MNKYQPTRGVNIPCLNTLILALALIVAGVLAFFLFLYLTGHDPDEKPLTVIEWVIGGALIGPGFGYLLKWRKTKDR